MKHLQVISRDRNFLPVTLDQAKQHLRVLHQEEDVLIEAYIRAATRAVEDHTSSFVGPAVVEERFSELPHRAALELCCAPFREIDTITIGSAAYTPAANAVVKTERAAYLYPTDGQFPDVGSSQPAAVVRYAVGYATADTVPESIQIAVLLMVGDLYEHRTDAPRQLPTASQRLLRPFVNDQMMHVQ